MTVGWGLLVVSSVWVLRVFCFLLSVIRHLVSLLQLVVFFLCVFCFDCFLCVSVPCLVVSQCVCCAVVQW